METRLVLIADIRKLYQEDKNFQTGTGLSTVRGNRHPFIDFSDSVADIGAALNRLLAETLEQNSPLWHSRP